MSDLGTLQATLGVDTSPLGHARSKMGQFQNSATQSFGKVDKSAGSLGKTFKTLGVSIVAALSVRQIIKFSQTAVKEFGKVEQSLAKASTLFGDVAVNEGNLLDQTMALSSATGLAADSIGESLYQALSAGVDVSKDMNASMEFLESNTKLAKAGFTDMSTAVEATAKTLNSYGMAIDETDRIHKILMQTQNAGITTVDMLGKHLSKVTPIAGVLGVEFEQVGSALATMTAQGIRTEMATTQVRSMFNELAKGGTVSSEALKEASENAGLGQDTFKGLMKSGKTLTEVLDLLEEHAQNTNRSMMDMFSSQEAGMAAIALSGSNADKFNSVLEDMYDSTDVLGQAYDKVMDTFNEQTNVFKNNVSLLSSTIGQMFAPALGDVVEGLNDWVVGNRQLLSQNMNDHIESVSSAVNDFLIPSFKSGLTWILRIGEVSSVIFGALKDSAVMVSKAVIDSLKGPIDAVDDFVRTITGIDDQEAWIDVGLRLKGEVYEKLKANDFESLLETVATIGVGLYIGKAAISSFVSLAKGVFMASSFFGKTVVPGALAATYIAIEFSKAEDPTDVIENALNSAANALPWLLISPKAALIRFTVSFIFEEDSIIRKKINEQFDKMDEWFDDFMITLGFEPDQKSFEESFEQFKKDNDLEWELQNTPKFNWDPEGAKESLDDMWDTIQGYWDSITSPFKAFFEWDKRITADFKDGLQKLIQDVKDILGPVWDWLFKGEELPETKQSSLDSSSSDTGSDSGIAIRNILNSNKPSTVRLAEILNIEGGQELARQITKELEGISYSDLFPDPGKEWYEKGASVGEDTANVVLEKFKEKWEIKSPSKVMQRYGGYLAKGLEIGVVDPMSSVGISAGKQFLESFKEELGIKSPSKEMMEAGDDSVDGFLTSFEALPGEFNQRWDKVWPDIKAIMNKDFEDYMPTIQTPEPTADGTKEDGGISDIERQLWGYSKVRDIVNETEDEAGALMKFLQENAEGIQDTLTMAFQGIAREITSALFEGELSWNSFKQAGLNALEAIANKLTDIAVDKAISSIVSWAIPGGTGGGFAKGGVFDSEGVTPFANGGTFTNKVVSQPTVFPFASGTGLMGEAGPEAVMPLTRIGGDLGVRAESGGSNVVVNIRNEGDPVEVKNQQERKGPGGETVIDITVQSSIQRLNKAGKLDGIFKQHGASRKGVR